MLANIFPDRLRVVFCGTAVAETSNTVGHYYARPGNDFWRLLYEAGFTSEPLSALDDGRLPEFGLGVTDLTTVVQSNDRGLRRLYDIAGLLTELGEKCPQWIAFNSLEAAKAAARHGGYGVPSLGKQAWDLEHSKVFVLPSSSGANRRSDYQGRSTRLSWWAELAQEAGFGD